MLVTRTQTGYPLALALITSLLCLSGESQLQSTRVEPGMLRVNTGAQLADALENAALTTIALMNDITLADIDFHSRRLILLERNVTIEGDAAYFNTVGQDTTLDLSYIKRKVRLAPGVALTLRHLIITRFREGSVSATPGIDLLVPSQLLNDAAPAMLLIHECIVAHRWCYPGTTQVDNIIAMVRASTVPGSQVVRLQLPQTGCSNSTDVPLTQRCWASYGKYVDLALPGADMEANGLRTVTNYVVWLTNTIFACAGVLPEDCIRQLTPLGCFFMTVSKENQSLPLLPDPDSYASREDAEGAVAANASSSSSVGVLVPALVGSLCGAAVVALASVGIVLLLRRRRQRLGHGASDDKHGMEAVFDGGLKTRGPGDRLPELGVWVGPLERMLSCEAAVGSDGGTTSNGTEERRSEASPGTAPTHEGHVVVTPLTPLRPDLALGVECGNQVTLLPVVRGKGSFGRVQEGMFGGRRVAVKLLPFSLLQPVADAAPADLDSAAAAVGAGVHEGGEGGAGFARKAGEGSAGCSAREVESFAREVEVLGRCQHPNVVRLLAACLTPPQPCLVMELMEASLDRLVHGAKGALLPLQTVFRIAIDIARGLEYLHPTIVHRDLKPANVLVNMSGQIPTAKLSDFGLSRLRSTVLATEHPEAGTPAYMAPECFDTQNLKITHKADIYAFAVIMWEMVTGRIPWLGFTPVAVAYTVTMLGERLPVDTIDQERCPAALARLLTQCFDAQPRRRPAAAELVKELQILAQGLEDTSSYDTAGKG